MSKQNITKLIIGLLFAAAIALGLVRSSQDPYSTKKISYSGISNGDFEDYIKRANDLAKKAPTESTVSFLAVGDIMLSRNVADAMLKAKDYYLPYRGMETVLKSTTFNFGNLESPFSSTCKSTVGGHSLIFAADCQSVEGLREYNFSILNLANNHALDQGLPGLKTTMSKIFEDPNVAISYTGVGENLEEAWKPAIVERNGIKICFVGASYASINDSGKTTNNYVARIEDLDNLKAAIERSKLICDFSVVTMHAGTEYTRTPNKAQTTFAHAAIDYGADIVIGAHPHWIQTIERYCPVQYSPPIVGGVPDAVGGGGKIQNTTTPSRQVGTPLLSQEGDTAPCPNPKYIFYSLGNFIFDQMWSQETKEGLTLKIQVTKNQAPTLQGPKVPATLKQIELLPVIIENYSTPRLATPEETKKILTKIGETDSILK